jgi:hypothetical protein
MVGRREASGQKKSAAGDLKQHKLNVRIAFRQDLGDAKEGPEGPSSPAPGSTGSYLAPLRNPRTREGVSGACVMRTPVAS